MMQFEVFLLKNYVQQLFQNWRKMKWKLFLTTGQMRELYLLPPAKKVLLSNVILTSCRKRVSLQAVKVCQNKQRGKNADKKL